MLRRRLDTSPARNDSHVMKKCSEQSAAGRGRAVARTRRAKDAIEFFLSGPGFAGIAADLPKRAELYDCAASKASDRA